MFTKKNFLYLITDRDISGLSGPETVRRALAGGIRTVQLREKHLSKKEIYRDALKIRELTLRYKALFIVNDYIDIALAVGADGVHLGQDDMPISEARKIARKKLKIGISTHTLKQAIKAEREGADYIGYGPVYKTSTKDAGRQKGTRALERVSGQVKIPVVAIGGITPLNVREVLDKGADAVAVASAILRGDMKNNIDEFITSVRDYRKPL